MSDAVRRVALPLLGAALLVLLAVWALSGSGRVPETTATPVVRPAPVRAEATPLPDAPAPPPVVDGEAPVEPPPPPPGTVVIPIEGVPGVRGIVRAPPGLMVPDRAVRLPAVATPPPPDLEDAWRAVEAAEPFADPEWFPEGVQPPDEP